ncbi:hypothetical protein EYZ11_000527 [Aspergillus tanneri]|uniref:Postreplication repair E3 ubiquitin-protein ligase RAD18 n=1 Tax=Aspergillus tanneri TaxID=1220188 RepID=A0A4S3JWS3_9EURO|nr:hypothetical protein EYZ11_000527 [Aspergillus tanneri]
MEQTFNLPDSTDWLDTPLSLLTPLESSLRCQVSRKAAAADRTGDTEEVEQPASKKRKIAEQEEPEMVVRQTRSQSKGVDHAPEPAAVEIIEDSQDEEYVPDDGLVACPVCNRRMKNEAVFRHLDSCPGNPTPQNQISFGSLQPKSPASLKQPTTGKQPERLPIINYSILKEAVLRRKLKDLGIPNWGPRPLLQRRHTEWMNLWNANCDSRTPKSKRELLHELEIWERTQGGQTSSSAESANTVMRKDFDSDAWSANYDSDFKQLIANARKRSDALVRTTIPQASATSDDEPNASDSAQPTELSIPVEVPKPDGLTVDLTDVKVAENEVQEPSNSQVLNAPST